MARTKKPEPTAAQTRAIKRTHDFMAKLVGPLTFAKVVSSTRKCDEISLTDFAQKLGVSRQYLCDVEKGRRAVSLERASQWARLLGYHEGQWVQLALQQELDSAGLKFRVSVEAA
jgi:transcriptional regulator with XRE-family HTH domain